MCFYCRRWLEPSSSQSSLLFWDLCSLDTTSASSTHRRRCKVKVFLFCSSVDASIPVVETVTVGNRWIRAILILNYLLLKFCWLKCFKAHLSPGLQFARNCSKLHLENTKMFQAEWCLIRDDLISRLYDAVTLTVFWKYTPWQWEKPSQTHDRAMWSRARESAARLCMCAVTETKGYFCQVYEWSELETEPQRSRAAVLEGQAQWRGITEGNRTSGLLLLLLLVEDTLLKWITLHFDWLLPSVSSTHTGTHRHNTSQWFVTNVFPRRVTVPSASCCFHHLILTSDCKLSVALQTWGSNNKTWFIFFSKN